MPLLDGDSHAELAHSLHVLHECLERVVALRIKLAVLEEFIDSRLLATFEHLLEESECDFGDDELVVVAVVAFHLGTFTPNFFNAVIVGSAELLQSGMQLITLEGQLV